MNFNYTGGEIVVCIENTIHPQPVFTIRRTFTGVETKKVYCRRGTYKRLEPLENPPLRLTPPSFGVRHSRLSPWSLPSPLTVVTSGT